MCPERGGAGLRVVVPIQICQRSSPLSRLFPRPLALRLAFPPLPCLFFAPRRQQKEEEEEEHQRLEEEKVSEKLRQEREAEMLRKQKVGFSLMIFFKFLDACGAWAISSLFCFS